MDNNSNPDVIACVEYNLARAISAIKAITVAGVIRELDADGMEDEELDDRVIWAIENELRSMF